MGKPKYVCVCVASGWQIANKGCLITMGAAYSGVCNTCTTKYIWSGGSYIFYKLARVNILYISSIVCYNSIFFLFLFEEVLTNFIFLIIYY